MQSLGGRMKGKGVPDLKSKRYPGPRYLLIGAKIEDSLPI